MLSAGITKAYRAPRDRDASDHGTRKELTTVLERGGGLEQFPNVFRDLFERGELLLQWQREEPVQNLAAL